MGMGRAAKTVEILNALPARFLAALDCRGTPRLLHSARHSGRMSISRTSRDAMSMYPRLLGIAAVVFGFGLSEALPAGDVWKGSWKFEIDRRDNPMLAYYDTRGRTIFRIYCGTHFETDAVYPGAAPKEDDTPASITIANGKTQMDFAGFTYLLDGPGSEGWPPNTTMFNQADLGYARDDPELYQDKWHALENRVFDFLDSGRPLTISAEGKSYALPPVNAPRWRARFQKIC